MEKYSTVDLGYFGPRPSLFIHTSDTETFAWLIEELQKIRNNFSLKDKRFDTQENIIGAQVRRLGGKDALARDFIKQLLLDSGYEPYSTTPFAEIYHTINFRKLISAPAIMPATARMERTDTKPDTYVMARVRTPEKMGATLAITSTHPAILDWLSYEAQQFIPDIEIDELFAGIVTDEMKEYSIAFRDERGALGFKLKQLLLDNGWEPLDWDTFRIRNSK